MNYRIIEKIRNIENMRVSHVVNNIVNGVYNDPKFNSVGSVVVDLDKKKIELMSKGLSNYEEVRSEIEKALV